MAAIIGRKRGMTQVFDDAGALQPVTVIEAGPNVVVGLRSPERDGYAAVRLAYEEIPDRKATRPARGVFEKVGLRPHRVIREVRVRPGEAPERGDQVRADAFRAGDVVDITGTSRGKGFAGAMKRHGFAGQRKTHGVSLMHRAVGSIGSSNVGRVFPGKRMPGRMGSERVTVKGLRVVRVDAQRNLVLVRGAVPGPNGALVIVRSSATRRRKGRS